MSVVFCLDNLITQLIESHGRKRGWEESLFFHYYFFEGGKCFRKKSFFLQQKKVVFEKKTAHSAKPFESDLRGMKG